MSAALMLLGAGCSGINATHSVSPLDFFLPGGAGLMRGFLYNEPGGQTNSVQANPAPRKESVKLIAQAK